jgi:hypothetical protein
MRPTMAVLCAAALAGSTACYHSTQLAATWRDPGARPLNFQKGVAVFVTKDEAMRRTVEDKLAAKFQNVIPSYRILPAIDSTISRAEVTSQLREAGYDGVIMMRVADVTIAPVYVPGSYWYDRPYGFNYYWGYAWATPFDPGYVTENRIVTIETQIYSLPDDRLVFAARSETTNPRSARRLTDSVIRHIRDRLHKDGLIAALLTKTMSWLG